MIRFFDISLSLFALFFFLPLFILIIFLLKFTGEGEIFFLQQRVGQNKKFFYLYKFVTMFKNSPYIGSKTITIKNDRRIFLLGKFLRKLKINELPQLINVLIGDMSLIGPRPLTIENFKAYSKKTQSIISKIKPGLSGIGSIVFKNEEKFLIGKNSIKFYFLTIAPYKGELEIWFVKNYSILNYIILIYLTIHSLIFQKSKIIWRVFKNLPIPPNKISKIINFNK